jgi:hypothetical protein
MVESFIFFGQCLYLCISTQWTHKQCLLSQLHKTALLCRTFYTFFSINFLFQFCGIWICTNEWGNLVDIYIRWTKGQCYNHNFLRFSPFFRRKNWRFSQKPMFWSNFYKNSLSLSKKIFRQFYVSSYQILHMHVCLLYLSKKWTKKRISYSQILPLYV